MDLIIQDISYKWNHTICGLCVWHLLFHMRSPRFVSVVVSVSLWTTQVPLVLFFESWCDILEWHHSLTFFGAQSKDLISLLYWEGKHWYAREGGRFTLEYVCIELNSLCTCRPGSTMWAIRENYTLCFPQLSEGGILRFPKSYFLWDKLSQLLQLTVVMCFWGLSAS